MSIETGRVALNPENVVIRLEHERTNIDSNVQKAQLVVDAQENGNFWKLPERTQTALESKFQRGPNGRIMVVKTDTQVSKEMGISRRGASKLVQRGLRELRSA